MDTLSERLRFGAIFGLAMGVIYAGWFVVIVVVNDPGYLRSRGIDAPLLIAAYLVGGFVGGGAAGLMLPLGRGFLGAAVIGFVIAVPVLHLIGLAGGMPDPLSSDEIWTTVMSAGLLGPASGVIVRRLFRGTDRADERSAARRMRRRP